MASDSGSLSGSSIADAHEARTFLKQVTLASAATQAVAQTPASAAAALASPAASEIAFPQFSPDGISPPSPSRWAASAPGASQPGRARQLRDREIFNRPDKGNAPSYAFPAISAQAEPASPSRACSIAHPDRPSKAPAGLAPTTHPVSRASLRPPSPANSTGAHRLLRWRTAVKVSLKAFSPFIPHEPERPACRWPSCAIESATPDRRRLKSLLRGPSRIPLGTHSPETHERTSTRHPNGSPVF